MSCWWRFLEVVAVIFTIKAHNLFHSLAAPSSLHLHTLLTWTIGLAKQRFLSDQYCVQSLGYKRLVLSQAIYMPRLSSSQQNCGELDCGLQFLCGVTDVSWWKGKKNKQGYSFFKASIASPVTLWHSLRYSTMTVRQHCVPTSASSWLLVSEDALPRCSPGDNLCYQVQAIHFPPEPSCSRDLGFWLNKNLH